MESRPATLELPGGALPDNMIQYAIWCLHNPGVLRRKTIKLAREWTGVGKAVHVAETDEQAREEAAPHLATPRMADPEFRGAGRQMVQQSGMGYGPDGRYAAEAGTPERLELRRVFRERSKSYDFWIDNGLALVGSPATVIRKIQEQHAFIGHDVLCTQHGFGHLAPNLVQKSIKLFGEEVIPAFA